MTDTKHWKAVSSGRKGGLARKMALSPERRRQIARKAARARWGRKGGRK